MKCFGIKVLCLSIFIFLQGCNNGNSTSPANEGEEEKQEKAIFHQQKELSFGDSLNIRILSWGGATTGSYLVLLADSTNRYYVGNSFFRNGKISDAWADDLDNDGWPEIGVVVQDSGGRKFTNLRLHELTRGFDYQTIAMPALNEAMGSDYGGFDTLYRVGNNIVREFSLMDRTDTTAANPARRQVIYHYENKQLVPGESKDLPPQE